MDSTQKRLSAEAWSMLESLSALRKSVQKELDFLHSVSPDLSSDKLDSLIVSIDHFSGEISDFLMAMKNSTDKDALEMEFVNLSERYASLKRLVHALIKD